MSQTIKWIFAQVDQWFIGHLCLSVERALSMDTEPSCCFTESRPVLRPREHLEHVIKENICIRIDDVFPGADYNHR